jgi:hypothetical protein
MLGHSANIGGDMDFLQSPPLLRNTFDSDATLQSYIARALPADVAGAIRPTFSNSARTRRRLGSTRVRARRRRRSSRNGTRGASASTASRRRRRGNVALRSPHATASSPPATKLTLAR